MIQRLIKLMYHNYLFILSNLNFINIHFFLFLFLIVYNFVYGLNYYGLLSFTLSFIISFYIFYHYTYSKIFKALLVFSLIFIATVFIISNLIVQFELISLDNLDVNMSKMISDGGSSTNLNTNTITNSDSSPSTTGKMIGNVSTSNDSNKDIVTISLDKETLKKSVDVIGQALKISVENIAPNMGAGAAAGAIGAATIKYSAGLPPLQRLAAVSTTTAVGALSTKIGFGIGTTVLTNLNMSTIQQSPHSNPDPNKIPSPSIHQFVSSIKPAESNVNLLDVSPLEELIRYSYLINILIIILLISMAILYFNKYILQGNFKILLNISNKILPNKYNIMLKNKFENGVQLNNKFILFMFILNLLLMIILLLMNLYISAELVVNIDSYVNVYNFVHSK